MASNYIRMFRKKKTSARPLSSPSVWETHPSHFSDDVGTMYLVATKLGRRYSLSQRAVSRYNSTVNLNSSDYWSKMVHRVKAGKQGGQSKGDFVLLFHGSQAVWTDNALHHWNIIAAVQPCAGLQ